MPPSRRGTANFYCNTLAGISFGRLMRATTINEMANIMGSRYFKVNLMSFQRHGTIEFRQHSGTVNATKIANWVRFLGQFIDNSKARNTPAVSAPVIEHPALHGVQARLSEMFTSQGVVSLSAMCDTFGWLPHTARAAVTRLRRMGMQIEPLRGPVSIPSRERDDAHFSSGPRAESIWTGISESVVRYYRNRAAVLATVA